MTLVPNLTAVLEASAGKAFNGLVAGVVVVMLTFCLLKLVRRQNPGTRFAVWFTALVTVALLPVLSIVVGSPHQHADVSVATVSNSPLTLPGSWAVVLFAVWACATTFAMARLVFG